MSDKTLARSPRGGQLRGAEDACRGVGRLRGVAQHLYSPRRTCRIAAAITYLNVPSNRGSNRNGLVAEKVGSCPVDFSEASMAAMQLATTLVEDSANVHVVHVLPTLMLDEAGIYPDCSKDESDWRGSLLLRRQHCNASRNLAGRRSSHPVLNRWTHARRNDSGPERERSC